RLLWKNAVSAPRAFAYAAISLLMSSSVSLPYTPFSRRPVRLRLTPLSTSIFMISPPVSFVERLRFGGIGRAPEIDAVCVVRLIEEHRRAVHRLFAERRRDAQKFGLRGHIDEIDRRAAQRKELSADGFRRAAAEDDR